MSRTQPMHNLPAVAFRGIQAATGGARFQRKTLGVILILPLLIVLLGLLGFPIGLGVFTSLLSKEHGVPGRFVGLANFVELLQDPVMLQVLANTVLYVVVGVSCKTVIGFVAAVVLNEQKAGRNLFRGWMLLPWVMPGIVVGLTGRWMFDQTGGIVNYILVKLGLVTLGPAWLADKTLAKFALIAMNVWHGFPFFALTLLAGLQTIPLDLYEAAEMDGATIWQRLRYITLPWLKPVFTIVFILSSISTANDFTTVWVMTHGGPGNSTHLIATYAYQTGFITGRVGYGSAVALTATPFLIVLIALLVTRLWREDQ